MCSLLLGKSMNNLNQSRYYKKVMAPERDLCENRDTVRNRKHSKETSPFKINPHPSKVEFPGCFPLWE